MLGRFTLAAVFTAIPAVLSAGDARVTIRGTGNTVVIERSEASPAAKAMRPVTDAADPIGEAVALKARGASDPAVLDYLRDRQGGLPPIIDSRDVRRLRRAGAGRSVVNWLASAAAVDIGETGEGHEADALPAGPPTGYVGFADGASYAYSAYPLVGGYAASYASASRRGFRHNAVPRARRTTPPLRHPAFSAAPRSRAPFSRRLFAP